MICRVCLLIFCSNATVSYNSWLSFTVTVKNNHPQIHLHKSWQVEKCYLRKRTFKLLYLMIIMHFQRFFSILFRYFHWNKGWCSSIKKSSKKKIIKQWIFGRFSPLTILKAHYMFQDSNCRFGSSLENLQPSESFNKWFQGQWSLKAKNDQELYCLALAEALLKKKKSI